jgi:hypothetical protein
MEMNESVAHTGVIHGFTGRWPRRTDLAQGRGRVTPHTPVLIHGYHSSERKNG